MKNLLLVFLSFSFSLCSFGTDIKIEKAIREGDIIKIKEIVDKGFDLKTKIGKSDETALHIAVEYNQLKIVQYLIEKGVDINAINKFKATPLHTASFYQRKEIAELLLMNGAIINAQDSLLKTPLHYALSNEMVKLLLIKGADPIIQDLKNEAAICHLVKDEAMIKLLISLGVNINSKVKDSYNILHYNIYSSNIDEFLIKRVKLIIQLGADVNLKDNYGNSPLHTAASRDLLDICEILIIAGANVNIKNKYGDTPLHNAINIAETESQEIIIYRVCELLIKSAANVNSIDNQGRTPIHNAVIANNLKIVKLLVENKANINLLAKIDNDEGTPIYYAKKYKFNRIYRYLSKIKIT